MRQSPSRVALLLASLLPFAQASVYADQFVGSYAADGQCFCVGELPSELSGRILPTPVGGQSLAQICNRVGSGPGLESNDGVYNYPVYQDPQCGNGPFSDPSAFRDPNCSGNLDGTYATCRGVGPQWDLKRAFAKPVVAAAKPVGDATESSNSSQPVIKPLQIDDKSDSSSGEKPSTTVIRSSSVSDRKLPASIERREKQGIDRNKPGVDNFQGRMVVIDGQRYLQARDGVSESSGVPGSRIILDGLVFLKDDGFIDPDELYRKPRKTTVVDEPRKLKQASKQASSLADQQPSEIEPSNERAVLVAEKEAREQLLRVPKTPVVTPVYAGSLKSEPALDEILRKHRRVELEQSLRLREQNLALAKPDRQTDTMTDPQRSVDEVSRQLVVTTDPGDPAAAMPTQSQLNRIAGPGRSRTDDFGYLDALPVSFDVGGNGLLLEGSAQSHSRFQYLGRLAVASSYTRVMLGGGYYLTPGKAVRSTVVLLAGIEHGDFELTDGNRAPGEIFNVTDTGIHVGALTRLAVSRKFELAGGVGYSSYFEGDTQFFGGGYYHVTPRLDIMSRFELGDNDLLGIGFRYYY